MNTSIKVIKFTTKAAIVLAAITYLISLNIAFGWFDIKWCSNNFLFTVFGGAFASTLVVLICELQKYQQCKRDTIDFAFNQIGSIYAWLKVMTYNLKRFDMPLTHHLKLMGFQYFPSLLGCGSFIRV